MKPAIIIDDTTLRDGEQSAGVAFNWEEKAAIARLLDQAGVPEMEVGIPAMGAEEREEIRALSQLGLNARLVVWARMTRQDIALCNGLGVDLADLSIPASDQQIARKLGLRRDDVLAIIAREVAHARDRGLEVAIGCEDASRADVDFLLAMGETAARAGARRLRFADTVGIMDPFGVHQVIQRLTTRLDLEIEMHAHDDLGLATANTLAAARAGATHLNTTVNGLGERAGNAPLEEVALGLSATLGMDAGINTLLLPLLSKTVELASGRPLSCQKSLVGEAVFSHEAGLHVDGLLKDPANYQGVDPALFGRHHTLVLGKHSGRKGLLRACAEAGLLVAMHEAEPLLGLVRRFVTRAKHPPTAGELAEMLAMLRDTHAHAA